MLGSRKIPKEQQNQAMDMMLAHAQEIDDRRQAQIARQVDIINRLKRRSERYQEWADTQGQGAEARAYAYAEPDADAESPTTATD